MATVARGVEAKSLNSSNSSQKLYQDNTLQTPTPPPQAQEQAAPPFVPHYDFPDLKVTFTPAEVQDLTSSWNAMKDDPSANERALVQGTATAFFCQQFYENLLGEYPELKVLFPSIKSQASSMAGILSLVISQLDNLSKVEDILASLGKRHTRIIGTEVQHYELVGNALLKTLQDRIGPMFTIELENAWIKLYSFMANVMLQAGEDPHAPAPSSKQPQQQALYPVLTPTSSITDKSSSHTSVSVPSRKANAAQSTSSTKLPVSKGNGGYNPGNSYFKSLGSKRKKNKGQDCLIM